MPDKAVVYWPEKVRAEIRCSRFSTRCCLLSASIGVTPYFLVKTILPFGVSISSLHLGIIANSFDAGDWLPTVCTLRWRRALHTWAWSCAGAPSTSSFLLSLFSLGRRRFARSYRTQVIIVGGDPIGVQIGLGNNIPLHI